MSYASRIINHSRKVIVLLYLWKRKCVAITFGVYVFIDAGYFQSKFWFFSGRKLIILIIPIARKIQHFGILKWCYDSNLFGVTVRWVGHVYWPWWLGVVEEVGGGRMRKEWLVAAMETRERSLGWEEEESESTTCLMWWGTRKSFLPINFTVI